ncbi:MAG: hypothetical protein NC300_04980 [Bacteroidales bacterium]|nr:hypothetical protein [Clostridium sp.]MCM1203476.1 hypothetical protein [Bacteroidales bacterium]
MSSINGIWGNDSTSYYFGGSTSSSSSMGGNILGIDLAEYASVTRGSYRKLAKAYYQKYGNESKTDSTDNSEDAKKKQTETKAAVNSMKTNAAALSRTAGVLTKTGKNSLFNKVEITDKETGVKTEDYDRDKIYKAVSDLVESYNTYVKKAADSTDNTVLRQTLNMVRSASINGSMLQKVGIKIKEDNTLELDEETFKGADMSRIKTLFNGSGSFADRIQTVANNVDRRMDNLLGNKNFYTAAGTLSKYSTGDILDSFL